MNKHDYLWKIVGMMFLLTLFTGLAGTFDNVLRVNTEEHGVIFDAEKGYIVCSDAYHFAYLERSSSGQPNYYNYSVIYARVDRTDDSVTYFDIDQYESPIRMGNPCIEVREGGIVYIFYPKGSISGGEFSSSLYQARFDNSTNNVTNTLIDEDVFTSASVVNIEDVLHLFYQKGHVQEPVSLMDYHLYFDDFGRPEDDPGAKYFTGQDDIEGKVHSNTDIWIKQTGGGKNSGWPVFRDLVTTAGKVRALGADNYPREKIFRGGLIENHQRIEPPDLTELSRNAVKPFGERVRNDQIAFITIDGLSYSGAIGTIVVDDENPVEYTVYDSYPPYGPIGNPTGLNVIPQTDTVWTPVSGVLDDNSTVWVPFELWISGEVGGRQKWIAEGNVYIKDDITYQNTIHGEPPDGGPDGLFPVNETDYFSVFANGSVIIQYGHWCPITSVRRKPNTEDIYLYGSYLAMGESPTPGKFTFQYHFPKGSTPDQEWNGEMYTNIDLHRFSYPTSAAIPWNPGLDYPWYNPLWPEPGPVFDHPAIPNPHGTNEIVFLRGMIYLYGVVAQRVQGFIRRSGNVDFDTGIWDLENGIYGRHTSQPTGYYSQGNYDHRFGFDYYSQTFFSGILIDSIHYLKQQDDNSDFELQYEEDFGGSSSGITNLNMSVRNNRVALLGLNTLFLSDHNGENFEIINLDFPQYNDTKIALGYNFLYILAFDLFTTKLYKFDLSTQNLIVLDELPISRRLQSIAYDEGVVLWASVVTDESVHLRVYNAEGVSAYDLELEEVGEAGNDFLRRYHDLGLITNNNQIFLSLLKTSNTEPSGELYVAEGHIDYQSVEHSTYLQKMSVNHYPNPIISGKNNRGSEVSFSFTIEEYSRVRIDLFNIKGQLVTTIVDQYYPKGEHQLSWNGVDRRGQILAKGVYFYRVNAGDRQIVNKLLILN